ncbi:MAG: uroporphyrinogen-III C-methyltransferase [Bryobacteraceae bacterium]|nr:uroporphyrinogen-III C-methyltransferase [Bryobacteraceae bacterium]
MSARICLVGAGPGDPELLTVRAARLLAQADAVLHDRLISPEILALIRPGAEIIDVGKEEGQQDSVQPRIHQLLEDCARRYSLVVRLKSGDPFVFGRGAEEWAWLATRGYAVEIVPGISSSLAVAALQGIPPTCRGFASGFAIVTGHRVADAPDFWPRYAGVDTLIVLMGVRNRAAIATALIAAGRRGAEPVAFIENGTTPRERVVLSDLNSVAAGRVDVRPPAVFVVGDVVRCRELLLPALAELVA